MQQRTMKRASEMWIQRALMGLVVVGMLLGGGSEAEAAPPGPNAIPVAVVSVKTDDALDQAEALTLALRRAVRNSEGWSLGVAEQSLEFLVIKLECNEPIDVACEQKVAQAIQADRFIWSEIAFTDASKAMVAGSVNMFRKGSGTKSTAVNYSSNLTDASGDALTKVATDAIAHVTGGAPQGTLNLSTGGVVADVYIDGVLVGKLTPEGGSFPVKAGTHQVVVKAPGYANAQKTVKIMPVTANNSMMTLVPGESSNVVGGGSRYSGSGNGSTSSDEASNMDWQFIGGAAALGAGVIAAGVGIWGMTVVKSANDEKDLSQLNPNESITNVCDNPEDMRFKDVCNKGSSGEITQAVAFPIAGVAAGVGLYLLLTSDTVTGEGEANDAGGMALQVVPMIGPDVQAISVSGRF